MSQQDERLPMVILLEETLRQQFPQMKMVAQKVEAWINFAALKANWYADESRVLSFEFKLIDSGQFSRQVDSLIAAKWQVDNEKGFAYYHAKGHFDKLALIAVDGSHMKAFEHILQMKIVEIANTVGKDFSLNAIIG
jgi:hypothetical protein